MRTSPVGLVSLTGINKQLNLIHQKWPDIKHVGLDGVDPIELCDEMNARIGDGNGFSGSNWDGVSWVKVCQTVRALWEGNLWKAEKFSRLREFLRELALIDPRSYLIRSFYNVYLETFVSGSIRSEVLARLLKHTHQHLSVNVTQLAKDFDLFNPEETPVSISYLMLDSDTPYYELKKMGIPSPHSKGLMLECHSEYLNRLAKQINRSEMEAIRALLEWMKPEGVSTPYDLAAIPTINTLLSPWKDTEPNKAIQNLIMDSLVSMFGDPRLVRSGPWMVIEPEIEQVVMRWLTQANLIAFLDIVSRVIRTEKDYHMWPARRKFWKKQWSNGHIDAAWVALSDAGRREALQLARETKSKGLLAFADINFSGNSNDKGKCFLFIKCKNKIIVEGSHNFKVHIFDQSQDSCPKLFQHQHKEEKMNYGFRSAHGYPINKIRYGKPLYEAFIHDVAGRWMAKVETILCS